MTGRSSNRLNQRDDVVENPFKPQSWLTTIDFIKHLVLFNNVLISVLAEQEGGKTTFIHVLCESLDADIKPYIIRIKGPNFKGELLQGLTDTFHLRQDTAGSLPSIIEQINERKTPVLVLVDDAHYLSDPFLEEMVQALLAQGNTGYFHVCLVADYSLAASLNALQADAFKNRIHRIELGALTENEMKTYLLRALPDVKNPEKAMAVKRLQQFYELTSGIIARINHEMVNFFITIPEKSERLAKQRLRRMIKTTTALIIAAGAGLWWVTMAPGNNWQRAQSLTAVMMDKIKGGSQSLHNAAASQEALPVLTSHVPSLYVAAISEPVLPPPLKSQVYLTDEEPSDSAMVVMDKVLVIPKTLSKTPATSKIEPVNFADATTKTPVIPPESSLLPIDMTKAEPIVRAVEADAHYTIQLIASLQLNDLNRFAKRYRLEEQVAIKKFNRNGVEWYVLTLGQFSQRDQAKLALNKLPADVLQLKNQVKPWIRPLSGLQAMG